MRLCKFEKAKSKIAVALEQFVAAGYHEPLGFEINLKENTLFPSSEII
jgi:hypothetical protein